MEQQITQLTAVVEALETLTLTGSKNCGTYYNCMKMLAQTIQELKQLQAEQDEPVEDNIEDTQAEVTE
jgi:hypothetical protein